MLASRTRKLESLQKIFQKLVKKSDKTIIIVEGKKDYLSLRKLGVKGKILCVKKSEKILFDILDQVQEKEVVLLVDFDEYGRTLATSVTRYLEKKRIKVNSIFWTRIGTLLKKDVKNIEGIPSYLEKLKNSLNISN